MMESLLSFIFWKAKPLFIFSWLYKYLVLINGYNMYIQWQTRTDKKHQHDHFFINISCPEMTNAIIVWQSTFSVHLLQRLQLQQFTSHWNIFTKESIKYFYNYSSLQEWPIVSLLLTIHDYMSYRIKSKPWENIEREHHKNTVYLYVSDIGWMTSILVAC